MPMSLAGRPDEAQSVRTIHAALDAGVTLIDTADAYCIDESEVGHGERLVARALSAWPGDRDQVLVATKGGHTREGGEWYLDGRPEHLRQACEASLRALGVEAIGLYQFHRPDPKVPFAESVGAMAELKAAGKVRLVGLSNVSVDQIKQARQLVQVASVQSEFSCFRAPGELASRRQGIAFLPWSPLGGIGAAATGGRHRSGGSPKGEESRPNRSLGLAAARPRRSSHPGSSRPETCRRPPRPLRLRGDELAREPNRPGRLGVLRGRVAAGVGSRTPTGSRRVHGHLEQQARWSQISRRAASAVAATKPICSGPGPGLALAWAWRRRDDRLILALARSSKQVRKPASICRVTAGGTPAPWRSRWRPPSTSSATPAAWLPSSPKKMTPIRATPTAPPTCWTVVSTPEAAPASWPLMPARITLTSGAITQPRPRPQTSRAGSSCQEWTAPP
jgi:aryl-alcohol dehydrogenase-like predicted oxidoreductase